MDSIMGDLNEKGFVFIGLLLYEIIRSLGERKNQFGVVIGFWPSFTHFKGVILTVFIDRLFSSSSVVAGEPITVIISHFLRGKIVIPCIPLSKVCGYIIGICHFKYFWNGNLLSKNLGPIFPVFLIFMFGRGQSC